MILADILTLNAMLVSQAQNEEVKRLTKAGYAQNEEITRIELPAAPTALLGSPVLGSDLS